MADTNLEIVRGDTFAFGMELTDEGGNAITDDLTSAYFTCRQSAEGEIVFQKTLGDGISKVSTGKYRVRVAPSDTATILAGRYFYDCQINLNSDCFTILKGILDIQQDYTY